MTGSRRVPFRLMAALAVLFLIPIGAPLASAAPPPPDTEVVKGPVAVDCPDGCPTEDLYGPPALINGQSADVWFVAIPDPSATFEYSLDAGPWTACVLPACGPDATFPVAGASVLHLTGLSEALHTLRVRAVEGGIPDPTPALAQFMVDLTPPGAASITLGPPVLGNSRDVTFVLAKPSGEPVHLECMLDDSTPLTWDPGLWTTCSSPYSLTVPTDGVHRLSVIAVDQSGNPSAAAWAPPTPPPGMVPIISYWTFTIDTTSPTVTIGSPASGCCEPVNHETVAFSANELATFECHLDSALWAPCTSPVSLVGLSEGAHTFYVRATDQVGNEGETSVTWTVDTIAPVMTITSGPTAWSQANVTFDFSSSESNVTSWCSFDGGRLYTCTSPQSFGPLADGSTHTFSVYSVDCAGNVSNTETRTWTIDTVAPVVIIDDGPAPVETTPDATFTFHGTDVGSGIDYFECKLDSGSWTTCTSPMSYTGIRNGSHTFRVRAVDFASNVSAPASWSWTIDVPLPVVIIDSGPLPLVTVSDATFTFHGTDVGGPGIDYFECRLDSGGWTVCTSPMSYSGITNGSHTFYVRAVDLAGNESAPATWTWMVDVPPPPETFIDSGPSGTVYSGNATFTFSSDQRPVTFACRLDAGSWAPCSSPQTYTGLADGGHTFEVGATNARTGLTDPTPATRTWTVILLDYRPDAMIRIAGRMAWVGQDFYADDIYHDATNQTVMARIGPGSSVSYDLEFQNDGVEPDRFTVKGCSGRANASVRYTTGGRNVTGGIIAGSHTTEVILPGAWVDYSLTVSTSSAAHKPFACNIRITSVNDTWLYDINQARTLFR